MAFEYKTYQDGENSYRLPKWRKNLEALEQSIGRFSYKERLEQEEMIQENEVGIKHPTNGSFIRIKDDGTIESFTGYGTGVRISPNETIQFFGDQLQLIGKETQLVSRPNHTRINGESLAGDYPSLKEKGLSQSFLDTAKNLNRQTYRLEDTDEL